MNVVTKNVEIWNYKLTVFSSAQSLTVTFFPNILTMLEMYIVYPASVSVARTVIKHVPSFFPQYNSPSLVN